MGVNADAEQRAELQLTELQVYEAMISAHRARERAYRNYRASTGAYTENAFEKYQSAQRQYRKLANQHRQITAKSNRTVAANKIRRSYLDLSEDTSEYLLGLINDREFKTSRAG